MAQGRVGRWVAALSALKRIGFLAVIAASLGDLFGVGLASGPHRRVAPELLGADPSAVEAVGQRLKEPAGSSAYTDLLRVWRKPGKISGAACANCHGPDGLELAIYNFDDATIRRRALPHLGTADADDVVKFIRAVRTRYRVSSRLDPLQDRPLQPGFQLLGGATPAERDRAFGESLKVSLATLTGPPIADLSGAERAANELTAVDPKLMPIGIPLNRFSEDAFHGSEHASLAHWLPDVPRTAAPGDWAKYYAMQDAYLTEPNDTNLWRMIDGSNRLTKPISDSGISEIANAKYRSLLLFQHALRRWLLAGARDIPPPISLPDRPERLIPNPMWEVGEVARRFQESGPAALGLDPALQDKKQGGPTFERQMLDLQSSWFWLGWLADQGLERTGRLPAVTRGDWLAIALWNAGPYPIHIAFAIARKQLVANRFPDAWKGIPGRKRPEWDYLGMRIGGRYISDMPVDPSQRRLYCRFTANCFRMSLYQMIDEWTKTKTVWFRSASLSHARALTEFIGKYDPADPNESANLLARCGSAIAACTERF